MSNITLYQENRQTCLLPPTCTSFKREIKYKNFKQQIFTACFSQKHACRVLSMPPHGCDKGLPMEPKMDKVGWLWAQEGQDCRAHFLNTPHCPTPYLGEWVFNHYKYFRKGRWRMVIVPHTRQPTSYAQQVPHEAKGDQCTFSQAQGRRFLGVVYATLSLLLLGQLQQSI